MWIKKKEERTVNLKDVVYFQKFSPTENHNLSWRINFQYPKDSFSWSFSTEEERDDYFDWIESLVEAKEFEPDVIGKLK